MPVPRVLSRDGLRNLPWSRALRWSLWAYVVSAAVVCLSVAFRWVWGPVLVAAQGALPLVGIASVVAVAITLLTGQRTLSLVGVSVIGLTAVLVVPTVTSQPLPEWSAGAIHITVYSSNLLRRNETPERALDTAMASDADVIVLTEFTSRFDSILGRSGLLEKYPTVVRDDPDDGNVLMTRLPSVRTAVVDRAGFTFPTATVRVGSGEVLLIGVHTQAPNRFGVIDRWERNLSDIGDAAEANAAAIAIGDFNSTVWSPPFRDLLDRGFIDAHEATGSGLARTWGPTVDDIEGSPAVLGIDHAISRGDVAPLGIEEIAVPGSDHRAILVTYAVR